MRFDLPAGRQAFDLIYMVGVAQQLERSAQYGGVSSMVERLPVEQEVAGSSPVHHPLAADRSRVRIPSLTPKKRILILLIICINE